jgi:hypothetical protein
MKVDSESLNLLHKLRRKYEGEGFAFDALLYYLVGPGAPVKVKEAMAFLSTRDGEAFYARVGQVLAPDRVYDFDAERARAGARKTKVPVTPEVLLQELKKISL